MHLFAGSGHTDQRYHFGVGQGSVDKSLEHFWELAQEVGGERHDHLAAGEDLPAGQVSVRSQHLGQHGAGVCDAQRFDVLRLANGVDRGG